MKGEIEKIWKNETSDGRKYNVLQIGGERYSLWEGDYLDKLQEGQTLEFDFRESGEFKNINKIYEPGGGQETERERRTAAGAARKRLPAGPEGAPDSQNEQPAFGQPDSRRFENSRGQARGEDDRNREEVREVHRRRGIGGPGR